MAVWLLLVIQLVHSVSAPLCTTAEAVTSVALENKPDLDNRAFSVIKSAFLPIEEAYAIRLSDVEYFYIYELLYS